MVVAGATWFGVHGMGSMADYNASVTASRAALGENPGLRDLVRFATLAPNGHNTQPWRFRIGADKIDLLADFARRTPVVDPDDHHIYVSLGCAAENFILAAGATQHLSRRLRRPRSPWLRAHTTQAKQQQHQQQQQT